MCRLIRRRKVWTRLFIDSRRNSVARSTDFELLTQIRPVDDSQIAKDVYRTEIAKGLTEEQKTGYFETIQTVLSAYSVFNPTVGYIQGMNVIVSSIIYSICDDWDNVRQFGPLAFRLLIALLEDTKISEFYKSDMKRMLTFFERVEDRVKTEFPAIHERLVSTESCAFPCFVNYMVVFGLQLAPIEQASQLLALAFAGGINAIQHMTLALIQLNQDTIMECPTDDLLSVVTQDILKRSFKNIERFSLLMEEINRRVPEDSLQFLN